MENKVYYGEYSLQHWIHLILKGNIILPDYQRHFVWDEVDVEKLIEAFKDNQFVPPVTIGSFKNGDLNQNLILDGQQRLTTILLASIGLYPDKVAYKKPIDVYADEDDDEENNQQFDNIIEWTFETYIKERKANQNGSYKQINYNVPVDFFDKTFLGFSYLVPNTSDKTKHIKFYSTVFRNINFQGKKLLPQESRKSLYYLNSELVEFFNPDFFKTLTTKNVSNETKADFVRYISLLSQFKKDGNASRVARSYKLNMEEYYKEYIDSVVDDSDSETYGLFSNLFPNKKFDVRFANLNQAINSLEIPKQFPSIIDLDMYLFGLIYQIVFENKTINDSHKIELKKELEDKITKYKADNAHAKAPGNLGYLRLRISESIDLYNKYINE